SFHGETPSRRTPRQAPFVFSGPSAFVTSHRPVTPWHGASYSDTVAAPNAQTDRVNDRVEANVYAVMKRSGALSLVVSLVACAPNPAASIVAPITCPNGSRLEEHTDGTWLERKCMRAGQNHGPSVTVLADGRSRSVKYETWESGQLRAE